jgi:small subunit ribosomal protein S4
MVISIKPKAQGLPVVKQSVENTAREVPGYMELDATTFSGKLVSEPHLDQVPFPIPVNIALVCEHLAHTS